MKFHLPLLYSLLLGGCAAFLPSLDERTQSSYLDIPSTPRLDSALGIPSAPSKADISHIYLLNDAHEAFVARAALIESADHTLDLQYYIWHNDISGKLLFNLIHRAAERGVRVRLLLDDNNTNGMDDLLLALDNHPNIEVRLFNPFISEMACTRLYCRLPTAQPPDAQQIVYRRQPCHHFRRPQYRRRIFQG